MGCPETPEAQRQRHQLCTRFRLVSLAFRSGVAAAAPRGQNLRASMLVGLSLVALIGLFAQSAYAGANSTWTKGHKRVLIIPIAFTDQTGPSDVPGPGGYLSGWGLVVDGTTTNAIADFYARQSYGKLTMDFTLLPEINMGVSYTAYNALYPGTPYTKYTLWHDPGSLADDARARAKQAGLATADPAKYDSANYDLDIIAAGFIPGQGTLAAGNLHGKGIFGTTFKALSHELGHCLGLNHANGASRPTYYSPLKNGTYFLDAYGDVFDLMGYKNTSPIPIPPDREVNVYSKYFLGWLTDDYILSPVSSGTYRVYAFDQGALDPGKYYAIRIVRDPSHTYWLDFRQGIPDPDALWSANGLEVQFGAENFFATAGQTLMIDMTPGSRGPANTTFATMHDAPLAIGRTYTDTEANLHITPIKKGGTVPESLDVVVNFGSFPGNQPPTVAVAPPSISLGSGVATTFTATASDPDGDTLAYYWEFDDTNTSGMTAIGGSNPDSRLAIQGSHSWTNQGTYYVRCTVTDMKGHHATASATVTVTSGATAPLTISGVVKDELGNPLEGAIVNNFKSGAPNPVGYGDASFAGSSLTGPDGKYIIPLPAIGAHTYVLTALYKGFAFNCTFAGGSVTVSSSSILNVNFTRIRSTRTISGVVVVAGRNYDPATDGALTVSDGTQTTAAMAGAWQLNEPDGTTVTITATAANPAYTVKHYFGDPYAVVDDFNLLHFDVKIPGMMPQTGFATSGATSNDTVGTVNVPIVMTPPAGMTSWIRDQSVYYWIDNSSTAEYGVDYKMSGGYKVFYANNVPITFNIPLQLIHDGVQKSKTVVIKLDQGTSITNLGPFTTFTYNIVNTTAASATWLTME